VTPVCLIEAVVRTASRSRQRVVDWTRRVWRGHQELMEENPAYRRQVNIGVGAVLGVVAMHPDLRLIASAVLALYVAAHEDDRGAHLSPRPDPWSRDDW